MAAGLGFKTFATGDVLTAADTNGYLMSQTVMVFADSIARGTAITSPQQGMLCFLKGTNSTEYYSGTAWVPISGSASPLTTKGDVYGFSTTNARIPIGTNNQVLTADSTQALGLKWATPTSGSLTLLSTTSLTGASTTVSSISGAYVNLYVLVTGMTNATTNGSFRVAINGATGSSASAGNFYASNGGGFTTIYNDYTSRYAGNNTGLTRTDANNAYMLEIYGYAGTTAPKTYMNILVGLDGNGSNYFQSLAGGYYQNTAITSITFSNTGGNWSTGTVLVYGVN